MVKLRLIGKKDTPGTAPEMLPLAALDEALSAHWTAGDDDAIRVVDAVLQQAVLHRASDVHIEPWRDGLAVRFRIDGILHDVARLPGTAQDKVIGRLKVLSRLVVYKKDLPQDGRIDADRSACGRAMRVSTYPTVDGEKAVIRLLDASQDLLGLDALGFHGETVDALRAFVLRPHGTLLLTGPASSGKTTTIYALLREILTARPNAAHIVTIEDPVEYRLDRVAQTQVNPHAGFTFEAAMRSVLRQDPDVMMVGEIRDAETARTAIQAGLTGHLVISTIHSGTAAGVFARLLDMGVEPFLIASAVSAVLAQRLVRRICDACAVDDAPDPALLDAFGLTADETGFRRGTGCAACQGIGYQGRTAIGELLTVNDALADCILGRPRTRVLEEMAQAQAMRTLARDGIEKVKAGQTTLDELQRVLPAM
ncbi:MAG: Type secretion system protein [Candidatus Hydrogenedentes bacterium]|nr:Type secretion system protein [Candidatus Hydrogenedentota bacterium]